MSISIRKRIREVRVKPVSISKNYHNDLVEELPTYDTVRRWLELQPERIVEGCNPVYLLKELLEQSGVREIGSCLEQLDAERKISQILN